jgi:hypothetical protein
MWGSTNRIMVQTSQGRNRDLISKITNAERSGGVVRVVECMPSNCEILISTSSKKRKKEKKNSMYDASLL